LSKKYLYENRGKEKNDTEGEENVTKPFYGPPSNCTDLAKLGYTLNGYYLVNGSKSSSNIEVVLCRFQLPLGVNESNIFLQLVIHEKGEYNAKY